MLTFFFVALMMFVTMVFGHVLHWAIHQRWSGRLYRGHMTHHVKLYPPEDYMSDVYRDPGKDSTVFPFLVLGSPLVLAPLALTFLSLVAWPTALAMVGASLLIGFLNDYIHDSFHVRNHWLARVLPGYKRMNELHYVHHCYMQTNFGIFTFVCDRAFRTFRGTL
jgi:hypothetical protein